MTTQVLQSVLQDLGARAVAAGDLICQRETITPLTTAGDGSITGAILASSIILRSGPTGAYNDTVDTADNIIAAIQGNNVNGVPSGLTWRTRFINSVAYAQTLLATTNTGIVLGTTPSPSTPLSTFKDWLITILNGNRSISPATCGTTSGSNVVTVTVTAPATMPTIGMTVLNAVANLQGQTVTGVTITSGVFVSMTMSGNANATLSNQTLNLSPTVRIDALN